MSTISEMVLKIISYIPVIIIIFTVLLNIIAFLIFYLHKEFKNNSGIVFLLFILVHDCLIVFTFNLNHYLLPNFGFRLEDLGFLECRIIVFLICFLWTNISLFYTFTSMDRLVIIYTAPGNFWKKLPFTTARTSIIWSLSLMLISFILNVPLFIINGAYKKIIYNNSLNGSLFQYEKNIFVCYVHAFVPSINILSFYAKILLILFLGPFIITNLCNFLIMRKILYSKKLNKKNLSKSEKITLKKKKQMTLTLIITSFAFLFMSLPALCYNAFLEFFSEFSYAAEIEMFTAILHGLNHTTVFFTSFCIFPNFRKVIKKYIFK
jgi:hypothetical protein